MGRMSLMPFAFDGEKVFLTMGVQEDVEDDEEDDEKENDDDENDDTSHSREFVLSPLADDSSDEDEYVFFDAFDGPASADLGSHPLGLASVSKDVTVSADARKLPKELWNEHSFTTKSELLDDNILTSANNDSRLRIRRELQLKREDSLGDSKMVKTDELLDTLTDRLQYMASFHFDKVQYVCAAIELDDLRSNRAGNAIFPS